MFKQIMVLALVGMLVHVTCVRTATAHTIVEKNAQFAEKVRAGIAKLGTGKEALVKVKLRDGTKLTGYVSEANEKSFVIADSKTGVLTTVAYPDVGQVKGNNLSSGAWVAITLGILVAIGIFVAVAARGR